MSKSYKFLVASLLIMAAAMGVVQFADWSVAVSIWDKEVSIAAVATAALIFAGILVVGWSFILTQVDE